MTTDSIAEDFPSFRMEAMLSSYWAGYYASASLIGDPTGKRPDFDRLTDVDEVWAWCFRGVKTNQWRLLGRFIRRDAFVGLSLFRRGELAGRKYLARADEVVAKWGAAGLPAPVRSSKIKDYLTGVVRDVDKDL